MARTYPVLRRGESFALLAALVVFFLVGMGPVWQHPWDVDASILYSYVPIPALVAIALALKRQLTAPAWALHTLELVFAKFIITACILVGIWVSSGSPPSAPVSHPPSPVGIAAPSVEDDVEPELEVTGVPVKPEETGSVSGQVTDASGAAVAGALVFVALGVEGYAFPPPTGVRELVADGQRIAPPVAVVRVGQRVRVRNEGAQLHTAVAADGAGRWLFNVAVPGGRTRSLRFKEAKGLVAVRCSVHPTEAAALLAVVAHPFAAVTGADGRFSFSGVPAGPIEVRAAVAPKGEVRAAVELRVGATENLALRLR